MSRIGKQEIMIPTGTQVTVDGSHIVVKGPLGELQRTFRNEVAINMTDNVLTFQPLSDTPLANAMWGTVASHVKNMVDGVNTKFQKVLVVEGVGFRSDVKGSQLVLNIGFSHPVEIDIPADLEVTAEKNVITISGIDKELVGTFAASVRNKKKPEPYKGKGIKYQGEIIKRKQGKKSV